MSTFWCLQRPRHLVDREWDGEIVVLNTLTGDTHLLGPVAAVIYRALQRAPHFDDELTEHLVGELDTEEVTDARGLVEATLLEFSRLGLIASSSVENR